MRCCLALWSALGVLLLVCDRWLPTCVGMGPCGEGMAGPGARLELSLTGLGLLLGSVGLAWATRSVWLELRAARDVRRLPLAGCPTALQRLAARLGIQRLELVASSTP